MIVVADTSVILNLTFVGQEQLLTHLFGEVLIPPAVHAEFLRLSSAPGRFAGLILPASLQTRPASGIPASLRGDQRLDAGETEALALALELRADFVLMDEAAGRHAALRHGLVPIGVLGLLIRGKRKGLLPAVAPILGTLVRQAKFRASQSLLRETLRLANEAP